MAVLAARTHWVQHFLSRTYETFREIFAAKTTPCIGVLARPEVKNVYQVYDATTKKAASYSGMDGSNKPRVKSNSLEFIVAEGCFSCAWASILLYGKFGTHLLARLAKRGGEGVLIFCIAIVLRP